VESIDLDRWVQQDQNPAGAAFRKAVHTLIVAISGSDSLREKMVFHGALLLSIRFKGIRHTKDIDFVTSDNSNQVNENEFVLCLNEELNLASEMLPYGMQCKIQSYRVDPAGTNRNFQTLKMKMAYAYKGTSGHRRLLAGRGINVIDIDYSFNERTSQIELIELKGGGRLKTYSLSEFVAGKYRAIIQQKTRNRIRRQDAFDIYWLLKTGHLDDPNLREAVYSSLVIKAHSREIQVSKNSLTDPEIISRSKREYGTLADEIDGELPPFEEVYDAVKKYYESLPWPEE